ncbi:MAG: hypothetical protein RR860_07875, partial [Janthinobacterium sp.]
MKNIGLFHFAQANMMPSLREATRNRIYACIISRPCWAFIFTTLQRLENRRDTQQVCPSVLKEV